MSAAPSCMGTGQTARRVHMKRVVITTFLGDVSFSILTTWLGPNIIGWFVTPADQPAALSCQAAVVGALSRLVRAQLIGTGRGGVGCLGRAGGGALDGHGPGRGVGRGLGHHPAPAPRPPPRRAARASARL